MTGPEFYVTNPAGTKAYTGPSKVLASNLLACGERRDVLDEIPTNDGKLWLVFLEPKKGLRYIPAGEVAYKPAPTIPPDVLSRLVALEAWARGIGYKF